MKEINNFIATFSTPASLGQNVNFLDEGLIFLSLNQFHNSADHNFLNGKINELRSLYNNLKTYIATMKLEVDLQ